MVTIIVMLFIAQFFKATAYSEETAEQIGRGQIVLALILILMIFIKITMGVF